MARAERNRTKHVGVYERRVVLATGKTDIAYDITYKVEGRKIWECVGSRAQNVTEGVAARKTAQRLEEMEQGAFIAPGDVPTFAGAWGIYFDKHLAGRRGAAVDEGCYKKHLEPVLGPKLLSKITPLDIQQLKRVLETTPKMPPKTTDEQILRRYAQNPQYLSPQSIKNIIGLISRVYRKAAAWGLYHGRIPTAGVVLQRVDNARERFLSEEEAGRLLAELKARSPQWHDIALLSLHTGLRLQEIFNLKKQHINIKSGVIHVMDAKAGSRAAYMTAQIKVMLADALAHCPGPDAPVFARADGAPLKYISSVFKRAADELFNEGVTDRRHRVVFHTLRHTFGSWLAQKGVPLYTIAELMGHSTLEMTQRYAKLSPDSKREAVALLDGVGVE